MTGKSGVEVAGIRTRTCADPPGMGIKIRGCLVVIRLTREQSSSLYSVNNLRKTRK